MSTTAVMPDTTGALSTEKSTSRKYVKTETTADGKVLIKDYAIQAEVQAKVTEDGPYKGMSVNWATLEKEGYVLFNENEFVKYNVKSKAGAESLVPSEEQFVYIFQSGLNYLQNNKMNRLMNEMIEDSPEPTPVYNQETIDLREYINEEPKRRSLTDIQKLQKLLAVLNLTPEQMREVIENTKATQVETAEEVEAA